MVQKHNLDNFIVMFKSYKHNISCVRTMGQSLVSCILILMARDSSVFVRFKKKRDQSQRQHTWMRMQRFWVHFPGILHQDYIKMSFKRRSKKRKIYDSRTIILSQENSHTKIRKILNHRQPWRTQYYELDGLITVIQLQILHELQRIGPVKHNTNKKPQQQSVFDTDLNTNKQPVLRIRIHSDPYCLARSGADNRFVQQQKI